MYEKEIDIESLFEEDEETTEEEVEDEVEEKEEDFSDIENLLEDEKEENPEQEVGSDELDPEESDPEGQSDEDNQEDGHLEGKSNEELLDMYKNLQKKMGEMSQELGSLRKEDDVPKKDPSQMTQKEQIEAMSLDELSKTIKYIEEDLENDPDSAYEEKGIKNTILLSKLSREFVIRKTSQSYEDRMSTEVNEKAFSEFIKNFNGLPEDVVEKVVKTADRLKDKGRLTEADYEASLLKVDRALYMKSIQLLNNEKKRDKIKNAKNPPKMVSTSKQSSRLSKEDMRDYIEKDPERLVKYIESLDPLEDADKIQKVRKKFKKYFK